MVVVIGPGALADPIGVIVNQVAARYPLDRAVITKAVEDVAGGRRRAQSRRGFHPPLVTGAAYATGIGRRMRDEHREA